MTQSTKTRKVSFRKKIFDWIKNKGKNISPNAKIYDVREDWNKLPEKHKNRLINGVKLYKEPITSFTPCEQQLEILSGFKAQVDNQGFAFLPIFESENFYQGLMYRPLEGTKIDAAWNREFYPKHCTNLFEKGYDPTLAGFADILYDMRSGLFCNWDSRHRAVGAMSADKDQLPEFGWNNALVIKTTAPQKGQKVIFADQVACYLFEMKNDTPKALTPVERFVAEYRTGTASAIEAYVTFKFAGLKLGTQVLPELENGDDARTLTGIAQFRNDYKHDLQGGGVHLPDASRSLKQVWTGAQVPEFSVFLILGYCHLLQMHSKYNGAWGFDNNTLIQALKWAHETKALDPRDYCTPRAQGKPYETIAFHFVRLAYNPYCEEHGLTPLSYEHFGFKSSFLETIGVDPEEMQAKDLQVESSLDEVFGIEAAYEE